MDAVQDTANDQHRSNFDIIAWHRSYRSCQHFFLDHGQHEEGTHALASFINIKLPCHWTSSPMLNSSRAVSEGDNTRPASQAVNPDRTSAGQSAHVDVSLSPYIRRLVVTGFAASAVLHGLFGEEWQAGVGPLVEEERRNFLFAAKAASWECVKQHYDMDDGQIVPRLKPLDDATEAEIQQAENEWSNWIMMQDWLVGRRAPPSGSQ